MLALANVANTEPIFYFVKSTSGVIITLLFKYFEFELSSPFIAAISGFLYQSFEGLIPNESKACSDV